MLIGVHDDRADIDDFLEVDQSCFGVAETRIGESRMDDAAAAYEATLTPDSLI